MIRRATLFVSTLAIAAAFAAPASADAPKTGESLYLAGHSATLFGQVEMPIVGLGYELNYVPAGSANSSWGLGVE
jgi:hypothetical protein